MERFSRRAYVTASLAVCFLALACSSMQQGAPPVDGTWTGAAGNFDFNTPGNWSPVGVPTGVATVAVPSGPDPRIHFSAPITSLVEIKLATGLGVTIDPAHTVSLAHADGLWMCCDAQSTINGNLAGTVTLDYQPGKPLRHYIGGTGAISGNLNHVAGLVVPGGGTPGMGVLSVKGVYVQRSDNAVFLSYVGIFSGQPGVGRLSVGGPATLGGPLYIVVYTDLPKPMPPFKVLTAGSINGRFTNVIVQGFGSYSGTATYSATDVSVTLTPRP